MSVNPFSHLAAGQGQQLRSALERESVALLKRLGCDICTANYTSPCYAGGSTRRGLRDQTIRDGLEGLIVMLPAKHDVPSWSVVGRQANVNNGQGGRSGAWVHPAVICQVSRCGHLVYCCPATSFGGQTIEAKYSACLDPLKRQETFNRYLALERPDTQPHNELGTLKHSGGPMRQQTYVHLDYGYWIEVKSLHRFDGPTGAWTQRHYSCSTAVSKLLRSTAHSKVGGSWTRQAELGRLRRHHLQSVLPSQHSPATGTKLGRSATTQLTQR